MFICTYFYRDECRFAHTSLNLKWVGVLLSFCECTVFFNYYFSSRWIDSCVHNAAENLSLFFYSVENTDLLYWWNPLKTKLLIFCNPSAISDIQGSLYYKEIVWIYGIPTGSAVWPERWTTNPFSFKRRQTFNDTFMNFSPLLKTVLVTWTHWEFTTNPTVHETLWIANQIIIVTECVFLYCISCL